MKRASGKNTAKGLLVGAIAILLVLGISAVIFFYVQAQRSPTIKAGTTEVKPRAYANKSLLSSITIPDSVTRIGEQAFSMCHKLQSVEIPNSVKEIGMGAFEACYELSSVTLPEGISTIRVLTFDSCKSLTDIVIPNSVTLIEDSAFCNCESLTTVTLGCGIEKVEKDAFRGCSSLKELIFADGTTEISGWGFKQMTEVSIPDSATAISDQAFMYCHELTSLTIPENVASIGNQAFAFCDSLKKVYIGSGVREIGWEAFANCESLTDFTVSPDNPCFVSVDGIVLDREMAHMVFCPQTLIDQNRAFIPAEWADEETLDAVSALKNVNSRVIPLNMDGEVDMNLFARLPEDRRALTAADADYALVIRVSNDESDDYVVKGSFEKVYGMYDTATRAYLCAKDGAIAKLCEIWHSPPDSGSVTRFGVLAMGNQWGDRATTSEIWSEIEDMFE